MLPGGVRNKILGRVTAKNGIKQYKAIFNDHIVRLKIISLYI